MCKMSLSLLVAIVLMYATQVHAGCEFNINYQTQVFQLTNVSSAQITTVLSSWEVVQTSE